MKLLSLIAALLFPPKCVLCGKLLRRQETDLCHICRVEAPVCPPMRKSLSFVAQWSVLWYYKDNVRRSLLRYKFHNAQSYASVYGRLLAMKVQQELPEYDILTWIPISSQRFRQRGYDQVELLAKAIGPELGKTPVPTLKKIRDNPPQSGITGQAERRANVLGVYRVTDPKAIAGKRILLLDDIVTTGATISEASRVLLTAGAKEVICAAVATAGQQSKNQ